MSEQYFRSGCWIVVMAILSPCIFEAENAMMVFMRGDGVRAVLERLVIGMALPIAVLALLEYPRVAIGLFLFSLGNMGFGYGQWLILKTHFAVVATGIFLQTGDVVEGQRVLDAFPLSTSIPISGWFQEPYLSYVICFVVLLFVTRRSWMTNQSAR